MYIDTKSLKRIIRQELDKRAAKRKRLKLEIEKLEEQQMNLRHNLEQISFVEDLAHSFHTVVANGKDEHKVYQIGPGEPTDDNDDETLVLVPEEGETSSGELIKRLLQDELENFGTLRQRS